MNKPIIPQVYTAHMELMIAILVSDEWNGFAIDLSKSCKYYLLERSAWLFLGSDDRKDASETTFSDFLTSFRGIAQLLTPYDRQSQDQEPSTPLQQIVLATLAQINCKSISLISQTSEGSTRASMTKLSR